jgi:hypothetical protein
MSKAKNAEYNAFSNALGKVLKVSPAELKARIAEDHVARMKKRKSKPSASRASRASSVSANED